MSVVSLEEDGHRISCGNKVEIGSNPAANQRISEISGKPPEAGKKQGGILTGFRGSKALLISWFSISSF